jgi:hypothetical protein
MARDSVRVKLTSYLGGYQVKSDGMSTATEFWI